MEQSSVQFQINLSNVLFLAPAFFPILQAGLVFHSLSDPSCSDPVALVCWVECLPVRSFIS